MWGFECHEGEWSQVDESEHLGLAVPLADGTHQAIKQVPIRISKKTLGIHSNAAGRYQDQVNVWIDTVQTWTGRLERGRLPAKWAWVSYGQQLWAKIRYGMGTNGSSIEELAAPEEVMDDRLAPEGDDTKGKERRYSLRRLYRRMLPRLGVNRNIGLGWRHISTTFGGVGLKRLLPEIVIGRINLFLQHYGSRSKIATSLNISLHELQREAGLPGCPLNTPFGPLGKHTTPCW